VRLFDEYPEAKAFLPTLKMVNLKDLPMPFLPTAKILVV